MRLIHRKNISPFHIIIFGFAGTIILGSILLMLPFSAANGRVTSFFDAFFTAVSAVCVTGLVVVDTASHWSLIGQFIIMLLIQIGGLGIVTIAVAAAMISGRKINLMQRSTLKEAISAPQVGGIVRLTGFILKTTLITELAGAAIMLPVFRRDFGARGAWMALFHSVSAFCNAGFDLMGTRGAFSSLTSYSDEPVINIVIILLIIIGGIGFLVWNDIKTNKYRVHNYCLQTKIVLSVTAVLIIIPALYFYFTEFKALPPRERVFSSLFQSVTPRTAGFNTADYSQMSDISQAITIILMLIGGSPGSTAGGMKTTTAALLVFSAVSVFRRRNDVECFNRRIDDSAIKNAAAILLMYVILFFAGAMIISSAESLPLGVCLFETASAIGTVGLSLGITPSLGLLSRTVLAALMFFGRVGGLTIVFAAVAASPPNISKKPKERVTVG